MAGINQNVLYGSNVDFTGSFPVSGQVNINGELLVGSTVAPFIRSYVPTGSNGLVVNTGQGTLDFTLANVPNGVLQNSSITISAGNGLAGGGTVSLGNSLPISLSTPVIVANGGTGVNTFANTSALITTGTSSTGSVQNIASVATGQVLTSAGTSTIPAWSATPSVTSITLSGGSALSAYTTGTFTPALNFGGSTTGITYTLQFGKYWKIGNMVFINITITLSSKGAQTGTANFTGLPFTSNNDTNSFQILAVDSNATMPASCTAFFSYIGPNGTTVGIAAYGSTTSTDLSNTQFANTTFWRCSGFYWT